METPTLNARDYSMEAKEKTTRPGELDALGDILKAHGIK